MSGLDFRLRLAIVKKLADGQFHSGEVLGRELGVTRAAISRQIKSLRQWGLDVFSVTGRGYLLTQPIDLLRIDKLNQALPDVHIVLLPVIDSTNQYLLDHIGSYPSGSVCLAEYQENGRGRRGRKWHSPFGANLYLSIYWQLDSGITAAMGVSLVVGVAIAETLTELGVPELKLKWPNDVYWKGRKLGGILIEMSGQTGESANLVIGLGLNISMSEHAEIDQDWVSLSMIEPLLTNKNALTISLISAIHKALSLYEIEGMSSFLEKWKRFDHFYQKPVKLIAGNKTINGISKGIDQQGALILDIDGDISSFVAGEISLRADT